MSNPDSTSHGKTSKQDKPKRYVPGWPVWLILSLLVVTGVVIQLRAESLTEVLPAAGRAFATILMLPIILIGVLTLLFWLVVRSSFRWWVKLVVVAIVISTPFLFKVEHSGDLFSFHIRLRHFSPDEFMSLPVVDVNNSGPSASASTNQVGFAEFMGPGRTGVLAGIELAGWDLQPPELIWKQEIGASWSGFVAEDGVAVTQEQRGENEMVTAYDIATGEVIWFHTEEGLRFEEEMGGVGPRATPTIDRGLVFAQGGTGVLVCLDFATGKRIWRRDLVQETGSTNEAESQQVLWGRAGSPLVVGDKVIVPAGGKEGEFISLIAYDRLTGEERWRGGSEQISYSSPVLMTLCGVNQIVMVNEGSVAGYEPESGQELWNHPREGHSNADANTSQPRQVADNQLLLTKGYSLGAELIELTRDDKGKFSLESVWTNSRVLRTKLTSAVVLGSYAFGLNEGILECVDLKTGKRVWKGGRYRHGQILVVGSDLIILSEDGSLYRLPAAPTKPEPTQAIPAVYGITWNNLCLWGDYLLVRNARQAACFKVTTSEVAAQPPAPGPVEPVAKPSVKQ